jgi:hypothetical protein
VTEPETTNEKPKRKFAKKNITVKPEEVVVGASFTGKVVRHLSISTHTAIAPARPIVENKPRRLRRSAFPTGRDPRRRFSWRRSASGIDA